MPDLAQLQSDLIARFPERWVRHHLASYPAAYFAAFDADDVGRHLGLMLELTADRPVAVRARPAVGDEWWVDVVGWDAFQFLSTLCNLLAVRGLTVVEGRVFTSLPPPPSRTGPGRPGPPGRPPRPTASGALLDRRSTIVDVFRVRRVADGDAPNWGEFQSELAALARLLREGRYDEVHHRLIGRFVAALGRHRAEEGPLEPLDLTINPGGEGAGTEVRVRARDSLGFLYLTASALALCGIRIVQAAIRTGGGRVEDVFWVTDRTGRRIEAEPALRELRTSLILIEHFSSRLPSATDPEAALIHFSRFATETMARPDWAEEFAALDRPEVLDALVRVLGESDFLWEDYLHAQPEAILPMVCDPDQWRRRRGPAELAAELDTALAAAPSPDERRRAIRWFKDRGVFRAGVRAILGLSGELDGFSAELTDVAEVVLRAACAAAEAELGDRAPRRADGRVAPWALCALGKCGGRELGFASDLELMLVYDDRGLAEQGAGDHFDRVVAALRAALAGRRGSTFDVDFRLRPYGKGGSPATSLTAFGAYYRAGGPAWGYERQALIKLRAVAGDPAFGREVETHRDRFVYGPEPFDLEGFRRLRRLQMQQLVQPGTINAKYSRGALVDVEYFVQALQIAHGGTDPSLRTPSTRHALTALGAAGRLAPERVDDLQAGYRFFRTLIDALRVVHGDAKDLTVPAAGSEPFALLARRMRAPDPAALHAELAARLRTTRALVERLGDFLGGASA